MTGNYTRGARYERNVCRILEGAGWACSRHPLSRGAADIDAYRDGTHLMVQVKGGKPNRTIDPEGWNRLYDLANEVGGIPILANKTTNNRWAFWLITGTKDGSGKRQPMVPYDIKEEQC